MFRFLIFNGKHISWHWPQRYLNLVEIAFENEGCRPSHPKLIGSSSALFSHIGFWRQCSKLILSFNLSFQWSLHWPVRTLNQIISKMFFFKSFQSLKKEKKSVIFVFNYFSFSLNKLINFRTEQNSSVLRPLQCCLFVVLLLKRRRIKWPLHYFSCLSKL